MTSSTEPFRPDLLSTPPIMSAESSTLLALSIDNHYGRATLLENINGVYRLAAWITVARQGERHLGNQVATICRQLGGRLGRRLWDERNNLPLLTSVDPTRHPPLAQLAIALSPRPPLRVWIAGVTPTHSIEAGYLATIGSSAQVIGQSYLSVDMSIEKLGQTLHQQRPDVVVVVGGYDSQSTTTHRPLHHLSHLVAGAVQRIPRRNRPAIIYAGNQWATPEVQSILQGMDNAVTVVSNVMPSAALVRQDALAHALDEYYWQLCRRMDGYAMLERWHTTPVEMTTIENNFVRLLQTWMALHNQAELYGLYCGERWMHVWANESQREVAIAYSEADPTQMMIPGWPTPTLISGTWPERLPLPDTVRWVDRSGMAPVVAALAPVTPAAAYQVLSQDLLLPVQ